MIESQDRYIKEVYYFDPWSAVQDVQAILNGTMTLETLRLAVEESHAQDEEKHGSAIYRMEDK